MMTNFYCQFYSKLLYFSTVKVLFLGVYSMQKFILLFMLIFSANFAQAHTQLVMNVFVHGTYPAKKLLAHKKSPVRRMIHAETGLHLAKELPKNYHFYKMVQQCHGYDACEYNINHFYTYGWHSSNLRPSNRYQEGKKLYEAINAQIAQYRLWFDTVKVRLIGSSHGGNVILNLLQWLPFTVGGVSVEVILLGTPIQEHTRELINNEFVHKAYSFYSLADWMQRIDPQRLHKNSSKKVSFWSNRTFLFTDKVVQIELKVNGKSISHGKYRRLFGHIPKMMCQVQEILQSCDGQHISMDFSLADF
jgi:hypothetical protein